jgi:hypothetical protein
MRIPSRAELTEDRIPIRAEITEMRIPVIAELTEHWGPLLKQILYESMYLQVLYSLIYKSTYTCIVTDSGKGVCVDPGEKGAILEARGPGPTGGGKGWQLAPDSGGEGT